MKINRKNRNDNDKTFDSNTKRENEIRTFVNRKYFDEEKMIKTREQKKNGEFSSYEIERKYQQGPVNIIYLYVCLCVFTSQKQFRSSSKSLCFSE